MEGDRVRAGTQSGQVTFGNPIGNPRLAGALPNQLPCLTVPEIRLHSCMAGAFDPNPTQKGMPPDLGKRQSDVIEPVTQLPMALNAVLPGDVIDDVAAGEEFPRDRIKDPVVGVSSGGGRDPNGTRP